MGHAIREPLTQAIRVFDRAGAVSLALSAVDDGSLEITDLYDILAEILVKAGSEWQSGTVEVWQEHLMTGIVRTVVEACAERVERRAPSTRTATVVLAAPDDEYHDLGLRMLADRFTLAGWRAHLLGAAVPVTQAIKAVSTLGADAIVLSASTHFHRLSIRPYVDELTRAHPGLQVWVGGPAFAHEHEGWPEGMILDPSSVPAPEAG